MTAFGRFTEVHAMLRRSIRAFVEKEVAPHVDAWEEAGQIARAFWRRLGELGFLGLEFPVKYGGGEFLSSVVLGEEMARCRLAGDGVPLCGFIDVGVDHPAIATLQMAAVTSEITGAPDGLEAAAARARLGL